MNIEVFATRNATRDRVIEVLTAQLDEPSLQIATSWPGRDMEHECIFAGDMTGDVAIRGMKASGTRTRLDEFTIDLWIYAGGRGETAAQANSRAGKFADAAAAVLALDPQLQQGGLAPVPALISVVLATANGPTAIPVDEGHQSRVMLELEATARIAA